MNLIVQEAQVILHSSQMRSHFYTTQSTTACLGHVIKHADMTLIRQTNRLNGTEWSNHDKMDHSINAIFQHCPQYKSQQKSSGFRTHCTLDICTIGHSNSSNIDIGTELQLTIGSLCGTDLQAPSLVSLLFVEQQVHLCTYLIR